jgi:GLPGLI family protein
MRTSIFLLALSLLSIAVKAQTAGRITFEEKMDLHKTLPPDRQDMKDMIPQFNSTLYELTYNENESIYKAKKIEEITEPAPGGPGGPMRFGRPNRVVYKNLAENQMVDSRDFMQKQFLIKGEPTPRKWKIGAKQKQVLGYNCLEATYQQDSVTSITAWFTPQMSIMNGPGDYQGLPGMILQIDINDGTRMVTATEIVTDSVDTSVILVPDKGKEVTAEEFEKIRQEKMKEMGIMHGGPGGPPQMMIIRQ